MSYIIDLNGVGRLGSAEDRTHISPRHTTDKFVLRTPPVRPWQVGDWVRLYNPDDRAHLMGQITRIESEEWAEVRIDWDSWTELPETQVWPNGPGVVTA